MRFFSIISVVCSDNKQNNGVTEVLLEDFQFIPGVENSNTFFENAHINNGSLLLRSYTDESSLFRFKNKNTAKNWVFEITMDMPSFDSSENGGLYIHYTKEPVKRGGYHGSNKKFNGWMFGLESKGHSHDLVKAHNDGSEMLEIADFQKTRDMISPEKFLDVSELRIKVISTDKNFKIELYGDGKLIYDRFKETPIPMLYNPGYYFGIVANYPTASSSKTYSVKSIKVYKRTENANYDAEKINEVSIPEYYFKHYDQIKHTDSSIKELLYRTMLSQYIIRSALGDYPNTIVYLTEEKIDSVFKTLNKATDQIKLLKSVDMPDTFTDFPGKIMLLEKKIELLNNSIGINSSLFEKYQFSKEKELRRYKYATILLGCSFISLLIIKINRSSKV